MRTPELATRPVRILAVLRLAAAMAIAVSAVWSATAADAQPATAQLATARAATTVPGSWKVVKSPDPSGATESILYGVSCTSARACEAVGYYMNSSDDTFTLAERWNGTTWSVQATPNPTGATSSSLDAVFCTAADACEAVGSSNSADDSFVDTTLAEVWNGATWSIQPTAEPSNGTSVLNSLSCTAAKACEAVGDYYNARWFTLAERWNGTSWSIQKTPEFANVTGNNFIELSGVSCTAAKACEAVGYYLKSLHYATVAEVWNGATWTVQTTPKPAGTTSIKLLGVSCSAAKACEADGQRIDGSNPDGVALAEVWNGAKWSVQAIRKPTLTSQSSLDAVSCRPADACEAVGSDDRPDPLSNLAEVRHGTTWSVQTTPNPGATESLYGVSCTAANACEAVGYYVNRSGIPVTLVEHGPR